MVVGVTEISQLKRVPVGCDSCANAQPKCASAQGWCAGAQNDVAGRVITTFPDAGSAMPFGLWKTARLRWWRRGMSAHTGGMPARPAERLPDALKQRDSNHRRPSAFRDGIQCRIIRTGRIRRAGMNFTVMAPIPPPSTTTSGWTSHRPSILLLMPQSTPPHVSAGKAGARTPSDPTDQVSRRAAASTQSCD